MFANPPRRIFLPYFKLEAIDPAEQKIQLDSDLMTDHQTTWAQALNFTAN